MVICIGHQCGPFTSVFLYSTVIQSTEIFLVDAENLQLSTESRKVKNPKHLTGSGPMLLPWLYSNQICGGFRNFIVIMAKDSGKRMKASICSIVSLLNLKAIKMMIMTGCKMHNFQSPLLQAHQILYAFSIHYLLWTSQNPDAIEVIYMQAWSCPLSLLIIQPKR